MRPVFTSVVGVALLLLTACSSTTDAPGNSSGNSSGSSGTSGTSGTPGTSSGSSGTSGTSTATINGKPAAEFYGQFLYETTKRDLEGAAAMAAQANGDNAFLASLFLKQDGSFILFYVEGKGEVTSTGHAISYDKTKGRKVTGSWSLDGVSLVAGPLTCNGLSLDGKDILDCEVTSAIVSSGAVGKSSMFKKGISEQSPSDSEFADYK